MASKKPKKNKKPTPRSFSRKSKKPRHIRRFAAPKSGEQRGKLAGGGQVEFSVSSLAEAKRILDAFRKPPTAIAFWQLTRDWKVKINKRRAKTVRGYSAAFKSNQVTTKNLAQADNQTGINAAKQATGSQFNYEGKAPSFVRPVPKSLRLLVWFSGKNSQRFFKRLG